MLAAKSKLGLVVMALLVGLMTVPVMAQAGAAGAGGAAAGGAGGAAGAGGGRRGGRGGRGGGANLQTFLTQLQMDLGSTDAEFMALTPKITAVVNDETALGTGPLAGGGGRGGRGGRRGGGGAGGAAGGAPPAAAAPASPVAAAKAELQAVLADTTSTPDAIKAKLDAYRPAVATATEQLNKDQADLKSNLTQRQEAVMVVDSLLG